MAVAGIVLIAVAVVLVTAAVTSNTNTVKVHLLGMTITSLSVGTVFIAGMVVTIVAVLGIVLLLAGLRRNRRKRKERKGLQKENERLLGGQDTGADPIDDAGRPDRSGLFGSSAPDREAVATGPSTSAGPSGDRLGSDRDSGRAGRRDPGGGTGAGSDTGLFGSDAGSNDGIDATGPAERAKNRRSRRRPEH